MPSGWRNTCGRPSRPRRCSDTRGEATRSSIHGNEILDIGCGLGDDVAALAELVGADGRVVGVDHDAEMLRRAKENLQQDNVRFERCDAHVLPFAGASFDAVRIDRVLMHVPDAEGVIREMTRVLRSGGRGVVIEPDWGTYAVDLPDRDLVRRVLDARADAYADGWVGRRLYRMLHEAGLHDLKIEPFVILNTNFEQARRGIDLTRAQQFALRRGELTEPERAHWLELVTNASQEATFLSAITLFMVAGTNR